MKAYDLYQFYKPETLKDQKEIRIRKKQGPERNKDQKNTPDRRSRRKHYGGETQNSNLVSTQSPTSVPAEITEEEKKEVQNLMEKLGL